MVLCYNFLGCFKSMNVLAHSGHFIYNTSSSNKLASNSFFSYEEGTWMSSEISSRLNKSSCLKQISCQIRLL